MGEELVRRIDDARIFLTMAAHELRRLAAQAPDVAAQLQHVAKQLETEAENLIAALPDRTAEA